MGIFDGFNFDPFKDAGDIKKTIDTSIKFARKIEANRASKFYKEQGYDPITIGAIIRAIKAGEPYDDVLASARAVYAAQKAKEEFKKNPPPLYGSASWSKSDELDKAELLSEQKEVPNAIFLGQETKSKKFIQWNEESHLLTIAPTRTGKGTMQIIPNLLRYRGSVIVLDPKGELAAHTLQWRSTIGDVYVINPFSEKGSHNKINPLDSIRTQDDAKKLANLLYPRDPKEMEFFGNEATEFLAAVIFYIAKRAPQHLRSIGAIRDMLSGNNKIFWDLITRMKNPVNPPFIRNAAEAIYTKSKDKGLPRLFDSLGQHMGIWDTEALRQTTNSSDFRFEDMKDRTITVYLVFPFTAIEPYSTFIQSILGMALDAMINNPKKPDIPVLFVLDEFLMLKPMERFVSALRTHASAGMHLWFFLQDLATLKQRYPTTWESFLQAEMISFFGTSDLPTSQFISQNLGKKTETAIIPNSSSLSLGSGGSSYGINEQLTVIERDLITPQEVTKYMRQEKGEKFRKAIILQRGGYAIQSDIFPWGLDSTVDSRCSQEWNEDK